MSEYRGRIVAIGNTERVSDKFTKRTLVVTDDDGKYPQFVKFEAHNQDCDKLDRLKAGDGVVVSFVVRGRAWTNPHGKTEYFNTLKLTDAAPLHPTLEQTAHLERRFEDLFP